MFTSLIQIEDKASIQSTLALKLQDDSPDVLKTLLKEPEVGSTSSLMLVYCIIYIYVCLCVCVCESKWTILVKGSDRGANQFS